MSEAVNCPESMGDGSLPEQQLGITQAKHGECKNETGALIESLAHSWEVRNNMNLWRQRKEHPAIITQRAAFYGVLAAITLQRVQQGSALHRS